VQEVDWTALTIFILLFAFITWLGFAAANWRKGDLDLLHEWGLGGRRFGTVITWFLVGGDLYTAYPSLPFPHSPLVQAPSRSLRCPIRSLPIRSFSWCFRGSGTSAGNITTSRQATSCAADLAIAGSPWR
jgi:hypothetical protein